MNKNIITVEKADIKKIGNTAFEQNGNLAIICNGDTANIEEILLKSILKCFGDDYKVISREDDIWVNVKGEEVYDILFTTNLPYELFEEVWHSEDSYIDEDVEVEIVCPEHGSFRVTPKDHLNGVGCPHCEKAAKQPKSNKIVKSILTIIMLVFIGLAANAQQTETNSKDIIGYYKVFLNHLSKKNFVVTESGWNDDNTRFSVQLKTPSFYDDELTRMTINDIVNSYSDIKTIYSWQYVTEKSTASMYSIDGTTIIHFGVIPLTAGGCVLVITEMLE